MENSRRTNTLEKERSTFALVVDSVGHDYEVRLIAGVTDAARTHKVNLVCYTSGAAGQLPGVRFGKLYDLLKQILNPTAFDGMILTNTFGDFAQRPPFRQFLDSYHSIPMVSIVHVNDEIPYVMVDNHSAVRAILTHLIEQHGHRQFAMIRGPLHQKEAEARCRAFCKTLKEFGLPFDESRIILGDYHQASGAHAVELLLERRGGLPDAIVAANDLMAIGAVQALQARGIRVPEDVAVTGFDDTDDLVPIEPPITTVRQPIYEQGTWAVESLLAHMAGRALPLETMLAAPLIVRHSCGCTPFITHDCCLPARLHNEPEANQEIEEYVPHVIDQMRATAIESGIRNSPEIYAKLVDAFFSSLKSAQSAQFLRVLKEYLQDQYPKRDRIDMWEEIVALLRDNALAKLHDPLLRQRAHMLAYEARILAVQTKAKLLAWRESRLKYHYSIAHAIEQSLNGTDQLDEFAKVVIDNVPALDIPACYVSLFTKVDQLVGQTIQIMGYDERHTIMPQDHVLEPMNAFPLPSELGPGSRRVSYLVTPIFVRADPVGYIVVEIDLPQNWIYEIVIDRIARAVKHTILLRERENLLTYLQEKANDLKRSKLAAESAMLAKSEFLANMSHEIRTPLNAIIVMNSLLLGSNLDAEHQKYAELAREQGDILLALVNNILDLSHADSGQLQLQASEFNVYELLEDALDLAGQAAAEKDLHLGYYFDEDVPQTLVGDPICLSQIIVQLLSNAVKFTASGEIIVSVSMLQTELDQPKIYVRVRDTGIGISSAQAERLFEPFFQVDTSSTRIFGGAGLGLALCRRYVDIMQGEIWVESELGQGATFHFTADVKLTDSLSHARSTVKTTEMDLLAGKSVLLLCDHVADQRLLRRLFHIWGANSTFVDLPDAIVTLLGQGERFDAVIVKLVEKRALLAQIVRTLDRYAKERIPIFVFAPTLVSTAPTNPASQVLYLDGPIKITQFRAALLSTLETGTGSEPRISTADTETDYPLDEGAIPTFGSDLAGHSESVHTDQKDRQQVRGQEKLPSYVARSKGQSGFDPKMASRYPLRILLAEDNIVNQRIMTQILSRLGYQVHVVTNGKDVLSAWMQQDYDLILMDIQMPIMDGLEASRQIRMHTSRLRQPRIVAVTAHAMVEDREKCLAAGMDDYLTKPVDIKELMTLLTRYSRPGKTDSITNPPCLA